MRSRIGERGLWICWFSAMCAYGLSVLMPLTAAHAQAPASSEAPEGADATAPAAAPAAAPKGEAAVAAEASQAESGEPAEEQGEERERSEPNLSLSAQLGVGYMSGGHGGLFAANRSPLAIDIQVMTVREPRYLIGGALRIELEGAKAVAGIARLQLRHPFGPIELRPGIGLPFYIAPRTMLGPEVGVWGRLTFSKDLALLAAFSASAFVLGDDIPRGSTVIMLQIFIGAELFI